MLYFCIFRRGKAQNARRQKQTQSFITANPASDPAPH